MFIIALFIRRRNWKQPKYPSVIGWKCPSFIEWINRWWYVHTVEDYKAKEQKKFLDTQQNQ